MEGAHGFEVCVLPRERALTFADHLTSRGMPASAVPGASADHYIVCVERESDVGAAKRELLKWAQSPFDGKFSQASWEKGAREKRGAQVKSRLFALTAWDPFTLTSIIEVVCVLFFVGQFVNEPWMLATFSLNHMQDMVLPFDLYRLLTPAFLHFGLLHLAFNLVMWEAMARPLERCVGRTKLFSLFVAVALISNVLQFSLMPGFGVFGGLSGVVYGVIGYFGVLSRRPDCPEGFYFPKGLLGVSLVFIGFGFFMSGVANFCHIGGFVIGCLAGFFDLRRRSVFIR